MRGLLLAFLLATDTLFSITPAVAADPPTAKFYTLAIYRPLPENEKGLAGYGEGVSVGVVLTIPNCQVTGVDVKKSKLHRLTDDKGTELVGILGRSFWISPFVTTNEPKSHVLVHLQGKKAPATGAKAIRMKADVVLKCGQGLRRASTEGFKLEVGQSTRFGPVRAEVGERDGHPEIWIYFEDYIVKALEVTDQRGILLEERSGEGSMREDGTVQVRKGFPVLPGMTTATIKVVAFESFTSITVPVELDVGIGGELGKATQ